MSVAAFVASQRTTHGVPHAVACRALDVSESWFYKWRHGNPTVRGQRRVELDAAVTAAFDASGGTYGSPRLVHELRGQGWTVGRCRHCDTSVWLSKAWVVLLAGDPHAVATCFECAHHLVEDPS